VVKTLVNYAVRVGQKPTLVDLDVNRGFFVPGVYLCVSVGESVSVFWVWVCVCACA